MLGSRRNNSCDEGGEGYTTLPLSIMPLDREKSCCNQHNCVYAVMQVDYARVTLYYPPKLPIGGIWRFSYEVCVGGQLEPFFRSLCFINPLHGL